MAEAPYQIAHILPWPSVGGTEQATLRVAQAVDGARFRSVCFYMRGAAPVEALFKDAGFKTLAYEPVEPSYRHPRAFLSASLALRRELLRRQIDLVHSSDVLGVHFAGLAGRMAGLPVLCHVRNRYEEVPARERKILRLVSKFAFVSRDTWRRFGHRVTPGRGAVVYDGLDIVEETDGAGTARRSVREEFAVPGAAKLVGMVARVAPQKDYGTLARAARRVVAAYPNVRFLVVGDCSSTPLLREHMREVRRRLDAEGVAPYFVFTDFRADIARLVAALDVCVLSTHCEGLPLVILEAMAQSKPVAATSVDGVPEIVTHGRTGLLHAHGDEGQLAENILSLLRSEALARRLGSTGREFVRANFSRERFAADMTSLYTSMLRPTPDLVARKET